MLGQVRLGQVRLSVEGEAKVEGIAGKRDQVIGHKRACSVAGKEWINIFLNSLSLSLSLSLSHTHNDSVLIA